MFKFNNSIVPNKVCIGSQFSSNKYAYRDAYSALKSTSNKIYKHGCIKQNKSSPFSNGNVVIAESGLNPQNQCREKEFNFSTGNSNL